MVKFVSKQALNSDDLLGVALLFDKETSYFYARGDKSFRVAQNARKDGHLLEVDGKGFDSVLSQPTKAGTVDTLTVRLDGEAYYTIKNVDLKLKKLLDVDIETARKTLFKGDDTFKGSEGAETFYGHAGGDKLLGKDGNDFLYGEKGRDRLDGGAGADTLDGGKDKDTYVFKTALDREPGDKIVKFQKGETIELSHKVYSALDEGALSADHFYVVGSTAAKDADDYIVYDPGTGVLSYDPDGNGAAAAVRIATLQEGAKLTADDIFVI